MNSSVKEPKQFNVGDIIFDNYYSVVAKVINPKKGEVLLIDDNKGTVFLCMEDCQEATEYQIEAVFNDLEPQWNRMCSKYIH